MKRVCGIFLSLFVIQSAYSTPAKIVKVEDGDTFVARLSSGNGYQTDTVRVRLINVDTPEVFDECVKEKAKRARTRLGELLPKDSVVDLRNITQYRGVDRANVVLQNGRDIGEILIKEKLGREYDGGRPGRWCN